MEIVKFTISGRNAFFKQPDVNTYQYFTFGNIHKVAILGILGAILGYGGYGQMKRGDKNPEFYNRLSDLKIGVVPQKKSKGYWSKKMYSFNNSVGYASKETGGNLIVKQQWLENPSWDIYILLDREEANKIMSQLTQHKCVFVPYLGSNDHPADIKNVEVLEAYPIEESCGQIDSFYLESAAELLSMDEDEDKDEDEEVGQLFEYQENLPIELEEETNLYKYERVKLTNMKVKYLSSQMFAIDNQIVMFY